MFRSVRRLWGTLIVYGLFTWLTSPLLLFAIILDSVACKEKVGDLGCEAGLEYMGFLDGLIERRKSGKYLGARPRAIL